MIRYSLCVAATLMSAACSPINARLSDPSGSKPDLPPSFASRYELLPDGRAVCVTLGLDPDIPGRCYDIRVMTASGTSTDHALWFNKTTTDSQSPNCRDPIPFNRLKSNGKVTYLCHWPEEDVTITAVELQALRRAVAQLNENKHKTLAEHSRALELKSEIDCHIGTKTEDCQ